MPVEPQCVGPHNRVRKLSFCRLVACLLAVPLLSLPVGCTSQSSKPVSVTKQLTPEAAKAALLKLMRSNRNSTLAWLNSAAADALANVAVKESKEGWFNWGDAVRIHPVEARYLVIVQPPPGNQAGVLQYQGWFTGETDKVSATIPERINTTAPGTPGPAAPAPANAGR